MLYMIGSLHVTFPRETGEEVEAVDLRVYEEEASRGEDARYVYLELHAGGALVSYEASTLRGLRDDVFTGEGGGSLPIGALFDLADRGAGILARNLEKSAARSARASSESALLHTLKAKVDALNKANASPLVAGGSAQ